MASPCLAVLIPVYNEAATVADVVKTVLAQPLVRELIVVDDGSNDGTGGGHCSRWPGRTGA